MKYIKVEKETWTANDVATLDTVTNEWKPAEPELYECNLWERFVHNVLKRHFSFGQPFCVVCGKREKVD